MKKIINGKMYNTDTATIIGSHTYGYAGDFEYVCETLYRKKNKGFFLLGEGGAMSKYGVEDSPNSYSGSRNIIPLSVDEAKDWLEEYGTADEYEACFGSVEE